MEKQTKPTVLILCTGNSCRSHMAEGVLRSVAGDVLDVQSAGSEPAGYVHPLAICAMADIGIDISGNLSKHMNEFLGRDIETVITVCDNADSGLSQLPRPGEPPSLAVPRPGQGQGQRGRNLEVFEQVRDDIRRVFTDYGLSRKNSI